MRNNYTSGSRKARSERITGKARFTHNSTREKDQADHDGSRINTSRNATPAENPFPHKSNGEMTEKQKVSPKNENRHFPLDRKLRGRPGISPEEYLEIVGRAENFLYMLNEPSQFHNEGRPKSLWDRVREKLLKARTEEEVTKAFEEERYGQDFVPHLSRQILKTILDPKFPKTADAQARFLADSIAALSRVSPRRSRNICKQVRHEQRSVSQPNA